VSLFDTRAVTNSYPASLTWWANFRDGDYSSRDHNYVCSGLGKPIQIEGVASDQEKRKRLRHTSLEAKLAHTVLLHSATYLSELTVTLQTSERQRERADKERQPP
jgi:hypothetical protein